LLPVLVIAEFVQKEESCWNWYIERAEF